MAERWGLSWKAAPIDEPELVADATSSATKMVWVESATNPLLKVADIRVLAYVAHRAGARGGARQ